VCIEWLRARLVLCVYLVIWELLALRLATFNQEALSLTLLFPDGEPAVGLTCILGSRIRKYRGLTGIDSTQGANVAVGSWWVWASSTKNALSGVGLIELRSSFGCLLNSA